MNMTNKANENNSFQFLLSPGAVENLVDLLTVTVFLVQARLEDLQRNEKVDPELLEVLELTLDDARQRRDFFAGHLAIGEPADGLIH
jgi:hypothetical protein